METILNRKVPSIFAVALLVSLLVAGLVYPMLAAAINTPGRDISDHALFDTTGGVDTGAKCSCDKTFEFYLVARAYGGPATIRITFHDGDWIEFPLEENGILSFTQAAGGTRGVDDVLTVTVESGDAVGWISILTQSGAHPLSDTKPNFCITI